MKILGLIGGTTWVSTIDYYRLINQQVNERVGGLTSAKMILYSVNFAEFNPPTDPSEWGELTDKFIEIAKTLEKAGAECIVFCANTPHIIADVVQKVVNVPIINIATETAKEVSRAKLGNVGLLGTKITMEQPFYKEALSEKGISALVPSPDERAFMHSAIINEMSKNNFIIETKQKYMEIINDLISQGAEGIILGCTEIPILIKGETFSVPIFDTTSIHVKAIVDFAVQD